MTLRQAQGERIQVHHADCVAWLRAHAARVAAGEAELFDAAATDPPYHLTSIVRRYAGAKSHLDVAEGKDLGTVKAPQYKRLARGFMGKAWDGGDVAFRVETWRAVFDCLKPGAHLVAFGGTRTVHRLACAIEDAGFEIRDTLLWLYGSGFPKSHAVDKGILRQAQDDRGRAATGPAEGPQGRTAARSRLGAAENSGEDVAPDGATQWEGWGTALKPACEPIVLARKPLSEKSVAANVLKWGTGALNIDGCRVGFVGGGDEAESKGKNRHADFGSGARENKVFGADTRARGEHGNYDPPGRWPANLLHDGSAEVVESFASPQAPAPASAGLASAAGAATRVRACGPEGPDPSCPSRFFYSAKAGPLDRIGSAHATVKRVDLMRWLERLICPPGGHVLDPFAGSGTTAIAAMAEGFDCTLIELEAEHVADIERKLAFLRGEGRSRVEEHTRPRDTRADKGIGGLFGELEETVAGEATASANARRPVRPEPSEADASRPAPEGETRNAA